MKTLRNISIITTFIFLWIVAFFPLSSSDIWWLIKIGEHISKTFSFVTEEFSFTSSGKDYINFEWLASVVFYQIHHLFGDNGLILFKTFIILCTGLIVYKTCSLFHRSLEITLLSLMVMGLACEPRFLVRPEIFTLALVSLYLYILLLYKHKQINRLYFFPFLQLIWVNMHAMFLIGLIINGIFIAGEFLNRKFRLSQSPVSLRTPVLILVFSVIADFMNPYTYRIFMFPFEVIRQKQIMSLTYEFNSPFVFPFTTTIGFYLFIFWVVISLSSFCLARNRDMTHILWYAFFLLLSMKMLRNMGIFFIGTLPIVIYNLSTAPERYLNFLRWGILKDLRFRSLMVIAAGLLLSTAIVFKGYPMEFGQIRPFGGGVWKYNGFGATRYLKGNGLRGDIFNSFFLGGFIIYDCYPDVRVFIDSRTPNYSKEFIDEYMLASTSPEHLQKTLHEWNIQILALQHPSREEEVNIQYFLSSSPEWVLTYFDQFSMIYLKNTSKNQDLIRRDGYSLINPVVLKKIDIQKKDQYLTECERAIKTDPESFMPHFVLGYLSFMEELYPQAIEELKTAIDLNPRLRMAYDLLIEIYTRTGNTREALLMTERMKKIE